MQIRANEQGAKLALAPYGECSRYSQNAYYTANKCKYTKHLQQNILFVVKKNIQITKKVFSLTTISRYCIFAKKNK